MGTTAHCSAVVRGSIPRGCADYITSTYPNRDPALNNRLPRIVVDSILYNRTKNHHSSDILWTATWDCFSKVNPTQRGVFAAAVLKIIWDLSALLRLVPVRTITSSSQARTCFEKRKLTRWFSPRQLPTRENLLRLGRPHSGPSDKICSWTCNVAVSACYNRLGVTYIELCQDAR
jgi:hypothetical protein